MSASVESLLKDLHGAGCPVDRLSQLVNTNRRYPPAVPILIRWLESLNGADVRKLQRDVEQVVRALAVTAARGNAAPRLIELFKAVTWTFALLALPHGRNELVSAKLSQAA